MFKFLKREMIIDNLLLTKLIELNFFIWLPLVMSVA
jgi:hypothetical protein